MRQTLIPYLHPCRSSDPKQSGIRCDHKNVPWQRRGTNSFKTTMCRLFSRRRAVRNLLSRGRKSSSGRRRSTNASGRGYTTRRWTTGPPAGCLSICGTLSLARTPYSKFAAVLKEDYVPDHVCSCPEEEQCYADQYGSSTVLVHQLQNETEGG